jgi:hypothetical protein
MPQTDRGVRVEAMIKCRGVSEKELRELHVAC